MSTDIMCRGVVISTKLILAEHGEKLEGTKIVTLSRLITANEVKGLFP